MRHILVVLFSLYLSISAYAQDTLRIYRRESVDTSLYPFWQYNRPKLYDDWFKRIVDCEGLTMPPKEEIDKLRFIAVNSDGFQTDSLSPMYNAVTYARKHIIVISLPYMWDYSIVAHEFLHFVLWYNFGTLYLNPSVSHPKEYFERCNIKPY
jgi:hypothetical protein